MLETRNLKSLLSFGEGMTASKLRKLKARAWKYPLSIERRYTTAISRHLKKRWKEYAKQAVAMMVPRMDAVENLEPLPGGSGPALGAIVTIAEDLNEFNQKELWAFQTIAVGEAFNESEIWLSEVLDKWSREQVTLITKATQDMRDAVARRVRDGVKKGMLNKEIMEKILTDLPGMSFRRARVIARDQASKLNAELSSRRMTEAGLDTYRWETAMDERVRGNPSGIYANALPSHYSMQGKICRWDDSTVCLENGEWVKRPSEAVYLHPGQAIMCRCVALPNWDEMKDIKGISIPTNKSKFAKIKIPKLKEPKSEVME